MDIDLNDLLTIAGASVAVGVLMELVKRTVQLTGEQLDRFGPALAVGLGIIVVNAANIALGMPIDPFRASLTGLYAGGSITALYAATKGVARAIGDRPGQ